MTSLIGHYHRIGRFFAAGRGDGGNNGQDDHGQGVGDHGGADAGGHGFVARQARLAHCRIGNKGVRRPDRAHQNGCQCGHIEPQRREPAEEEWHDECQQTEDDGSRAVSLEEVEVKLGAGHEHEEEQADAADSIQETLGQEAEDKRPQDEAAEDEADQTRQPEA